MTAKECFKEIDKNIDPKHREQFVVVKGLSFVFPDDYVIKHKAHPDYQSWVNHGQVIQRMDTPQ